MASFIRKALYVYEPFSEPFTRPFNCVVSRMIINQINGNAILHEMSDNGRENITFIKCSDYRNDCEFFGGSIIHIVFEKEWRRFQVFLPD